MRVATSVRLWLRPVWQAGGLYVYRMPEICGREVNEDGVSRRATELSRVLSYIDFNLPWDYNVVIHGVCACDRAVLNLHKYRMVAIPCTPPRFRVIGTDCAVQPCDSYECHNVVSGSNNAIVCLACWVHTHARKCVDADYDSKKEE